MLLVDDEKDILESLQIFFEQSVGGMKVKPARSAKEALEILRREHINLIVTDYRMPEMDGIQLMREARKLAPDVPAMMISAYPDPKLAAQAVREGGVGLFIAKPFDLDYLAALVRSIFAGDLVVPTPQPNPSPAPE